MPDRFTVELVDHHWYVMDNRRGMSVNRAYTDLEDANADAAVYNADDRAMRAAVEVEQAAKLANEQADKARPRRKRRPRGDGPDSVKNLLRF